MPRPTPPAPQSALSDVPAATNVIRPIASPAEYRECVALQCEIWGDLYEPVPAALLQVSSYVGGIAAGAFAKDGGRMVGFVFGLTGVSGSKIIHWSHMLGVRSTRQNAGVGRALKEYQRQELERRQIGEMFWTYDPLIAKNAHFNLDVLGARVVRYELDMYGDTRSPLHHGLPTDRLVVALDTSRAPREVSSVADDRYALAPVLTAYPQSGDPVHAPGDTSAPRLRLEIPTDFAKLLSDSPAIAKHWHASIRGHFQWALANGYTVSGLLRDPATGRSFYTLDSSVLVG
jgi:predicted GNAT superfamily acetyltransferase